MIKTIWLNSFISPLALIILIFTSTLGHSLQTAVQSLDGTPSVVLTMSDLIERWEATTLPEFLQNKKEDTRGEIELMFETDEINRILLSDERRPQGPLSALVHPDFSSLQHQTNFDQLISKLKRGFLRPYANPDENSKFGIYLELYKKSETNSFKWANVELHFKFDLLDRLDYHINPGWDYGHYSPISASPSVNPGRVAYYLQTVLIERPGNEIVFDGPIFFSNLQKIFVEKGKKQELLEQIAKENITCPTADGWDNLIEEK